MEKGSRSRGPLEWSAVDRCLLVGGLSAPLLTGYWLLDAYLLQHPDLAPYYDFESLHVFQALIAGFIGLWLVLIGVGIVLRKRSPESPVLVHATVQLFAVGHAVGAVWVGPLTSPQGLLLLGGAAVALVLFERRAVLLGVASAIATLIAGSVASATGVVRYAPLLAHGPWINGEISRWWVWQNTVVVVVVSAALLYLFAYLVKRLRDREARLIVLSTTDALTGAANRRQFLELLERDLDQARRHQKSLGCVVIDLDHFKKVNDRYGHLTGDKVLVEAARVFREQIRAHDVLARWGGEEFVLLLPETDVAGAEAVAERCRRALEAASIDAGEGVRVSVTASAGVAAFPDVGVRTEQDLLRRADAALYDAKASGRNRLSSRRGPASGASGDVTGGPTSGASGDVTGGSEISTPAA